MGLEALKQELNRKTASEASRIENEGRAEAKLIKEGARKEMQKRQEKAEKDAENFVERERMRIPAARLKAKRIIQDAKYSLVDASLKELAEMLEAKTSNRREYEKTLEALIKDGLSEVGKSALIHVRKQDAAFAKKYGKVVEIGCMGGAIISSEDGKLRINNTYEAILERKRDELEQQAFEAMFGKKN
ncbi:MAG: V-type ATP synthase subunit E [Candidatus Micrarchaeota archaeon]